MNCDLRSEISHVSRSGHRIVLLLHSHSIQQRERPEYTQIQLSAKESMSKATGTINSEGGTAC